MAVDHLPIDHLPLPVLITRVGSGVVRASLRAREFLSADPIGAQLDAIAQLSSESRADVELLVPGKRLVLEGCSLIEPFGSGAVDLHIAGLPEAGLAVIAIIPADKLRAEHERRVRLEQALQDADRERTRLKQRERELAQGEHPSRIIGASAPMLAMFEHIKRVAPSPATVLIQGESGSGKELVASSIRELSNRSEAPFIAVNCAAMPDSLIESELFGHERGAFTGADRQKPGKFELADTGTLFLDEVAELSPQAQAKLLRVLQEGTFERVGGTETIRVDVRLITATHRNLARRVEQRLFREDLFYRLNVFRIDVPPLRDRMEDLRELVDHFHRKHATRLAKDLLPISERSFRRMLSYRWPGNVRELENTIERATLLANGLELDIEIAAAPATARDGESAQSESAAVPRDVLLDLNLEQLQRLQIMHALETCKYHVFGEQGAAKKLGINPRTLISRMQRLGIPRSSVLRRSYGGGA